MWLPMSREDADRASDEEVVAAYMEFGLSRTDAEGYLYAVRNVNGNIVD